MVDKKQLYQRGKTGASGELTHLEGQISEFPDVDWDSTASVKPTLSQDTVRCRWVKNDSGGALLPGYGVRYKAAYYGMRMGAVSGDGETCHGIVDEYLPAAGVADGKYFWLVQHGPGSVATDGSASIAQNDILVTAAAGKFNEQTAAPADTTAAMVQVNSRAGVAMATAGTTDGNLVRAYIGPIG